MTAGRQRSSIAFIEFLFLLAPLPAHSETLKISATGRSFTQLPIRIAQVKGFYRDEELEVVYVQMTGQLATTSLFGGHVDATTEFSASATGEGPRSRTVAFIRVGWQKAGTIARLPFYRSLP